MAAEDKLVKKPFQKEKYSTEQALQLAKCMDPIDGPLYFMENFLYIQHATRGRTKFKPYPYQKELIKCYNENRYAVALVSRQQGKCLIYNTFFKIRNKKTGEIIEVNFEEFQKIIGNNV